VTMPALSAWPSATSHAAKRALNSRERGAGVDVRPVGSAQRASIFPRERWRSDGAPHAATDRRPAAEYGSGARRRAPASRVSRRASKSSDRSIPGSSRAAPIGLEPNPPWRRVRASGRRAEEPPCLLPAGAIIAAAAGRPRS
jgi:hypothetical protein